MQIPYSDSPEDPKFNNRPRSTSADQPNVVEDYGLNAKGNGFQNQG